MRYINDKLIWNDKRGSTPASQGYIPYKLFTKLKPFLIFGMVITNSILNYIEMMVATTTNQCKIFHLTMKH